MSSTESKINPVKRRRSQQSRRQDQKSQRPGAAKVAPRGAVASAPAADFSRAKLAMAAVCLVAGLWAYWPSLLQLVRIWNREPDYSHGFLVIPLAVMFLWVRRESFPGLMASSPVLGIGLLVMSLALRFVGAKYFFTFMDGWSIVPWVASVVATIGGWPLLRWCLPSIGFLIFMVPLPFRIEGELSAPLQKIATKLSTIVLQTLGQPAFDEGNVILLGEERLEVAQACSGLRLFVSVLALTYAYVAIIRRPWWEKLLLVFAAVPVAIISNSARIVVTGLIYQITTSEWLRGLAHDSAGWGMILFAAAVFWLCLWYFRQLVREEETVDISAIVRQARV
jgi:exosortase